MKKSADQWDTDWREVERLWASLTPAERDSVQDSISHSAPYMGPFHLRLKKAIDANRRQS